MVNEVGYKQMWGGEVAPARLISRRRSSSCPRLETIHEEGGCEIRLRHAVILSKKAFVFLPVFLSTAFYFLLYKDATLCA